MSNLVIMKDDASTTIANINASDIITKTLDEIGVQYERWPTPANLADDADQETVLTAYANEIAQLNQQYGFNTTDVVNLTPEHPDKAAFREKFLAEHTHADFEVRYFVDGTGLFYLHIGDRVYMLFCERGDLLSVPANTTHWFDMGTNPAFKCIRFFTQAEGWVGQFSGNDIASKFPDYDDFVSRYR